MIPAKVAELVDALASGVSVLTDVRVQVPLFAPTINGESRFFVSKIHATPHVTHTISSPTFSHPQLNQRQSTMSYRISLAHCVRLNQISLELCGEIIDTRPTVQTTLYAVDSVSSDSLTTLPRLTGYPCRAMLLAPNAIGIPLHSVLSRPYSR